jgi:hypothetical protein
VASVYGPSITYYKGYSVVYPHAPKAGLVTTALTS